MILYIMSFTDLSQSVLDKKRDVLEPVLDIMSTKQEDKVFTAAATSPKYIIKT